MTPFMIGMLIILFLMILFGVAVWYEYNSIASVPDSSASAYAPASSDVPAYLPVDAPPASDAAAPSYLPPAAYSPAASSPYLWDPSQVSTLDPSLAVVAGAVGTANTYIAAAPTSSGALILGKSNGTTIWYNENGEKKIPIAQGYLLPMSAVSTASWGSALGNGVALVNNPTDYVCRAKMANGIHPGYTSGGKCNVTYGGVLMPQAVFDYLNV